MQISLTPDYSLLAILAIFIINYFVVRKFFLRPINEVLEARAQETSSANQIYEQSMSRFSEATAKMEERVHAAKRDAAVLRERYRGEAAAHRATVVERTTADAKAIVSDAATSLERATAEARDTIVRESETLARLAAERILGRPV